MPYVADLMNGVDEVAFRTPDGPVTATVFERGVARFNGELAAHDGTPVPLGLRSSGEGWDVAFISMKDDGFTGIGVKRAGVQVNVGVSCGSST